MNSTVESIPHRPVITTAVQDHAFRRDSLVWVSVCALPAAALLAAGRLGWAANIFWGLLALMVVWLVVLQKADMLVATLMGLMPFMNLLRGWGFAFYNTTLVVLIAGLGFYYLRAPARFRQTARHYRLAVWLWVMAGGYYVLSVVLTGEYSKSMRLFELCCGVWYVLLAGRRRLVLGTGLLGVTICACFIGLSMLPHNQSIGRLGMVVIEDEVIGNPVQLGTALALGLLLLTMDRGWWLSGPKGKLWRLALFAVTVGLLALTTSRAAWFMVAAGMAVGVLLGRGQRMQLVILLATGAGLWLVLLVTPFGESLQAGLIRTFSSDRTLANRTSGRSDQWLVAYTAVTASPDRMLWGYGPGKGASVYARFSERIEGVRYAVGKEIVLHSLFMQVMVEAGLLGLIVLCGWLVVTFWRIAVWTWRTRRLIPLVGYCSYVVAILTVSGNDTVSGLLLGLGFLATARR